MNSGDQTMVSDPVTIHIVDDDDSFRASLARLLKVSGYETRTYASAGDFVLAHASAPTGCLLLDLHMPGTDGLALQDALRQRSWGIPIVFLSGRGDIQGSVKAIKRGAHDFLTKPVELQVLLAAISEALAADSALQVQRDHQREARERLASLTAREQALLRLVLQGRLTREIAKELHLSERTVKSCRAAVMTKLNVQNMAELALKAADLSG